MAKKIRGKRKFKIKTKINKLFRRNIFLLFSFSFYFYFYFFLNQIKNINIYICSFLSIMVSVSGSASRGFVRCVIPFPTFVLKSTSQLDYVRFVPFSIASSFPLSFTYFFNTIFRQKIRWIHWAFSKFWTTSNIFYFFFF